MINDGLTGLAMNFGIDLADEGARVNWKKFQEIDKKITEEVAEKLAKLFAELRVERRSQSYDSDTLRARGVEGLRLVMNESSAEPELINEMVENMERAFLFRLEEARVGRRQAEKSLRKTQLAATPRTMPALDAPLN